MSRRIGVVGPYQSLELAQRARGFVAAVGHNTQRAHAFSIERERFGKGVGDEQRAARRRETAYRLSILLDAITEALIGDVQKRDQFQAPNSLDDLAPLLRGEIDSGGVMATRMQDDDRARRQMTKRLHHCAEVEAPRGRIVVWISVDLEAGVLEQRAMILPARLADPDLRGRIDPTQEIRSYLEAAGAAQCLNRDYAIVLARLAVRAEYQLLHGAIVFGQTIDRQIAACRRA